MSELPQIKTIHKYKTEFSADSVEWCPHDPYRSYFVCANYEIEENEEQRPVKRLGRILLFSHDRAALKLEQQLETAAILDQKWSPTRVSGLILLGVATAQSTVDIYQLDEAAPRLTLLTSHKIDSEPTETLVLSLDWSAGPAPQIVASDSKGRVHLLQLAGARLRRVETRAAHAYEAWIAGFYCWEPHVYFSGGDDALFIRHDARGGPPVRNGSHEAGVTCFHSDRRREHQVVTGSYDSSVRFWDLRQFKEPVDKIRMEDTLWRLKFDPYKQDYLLAACMRGGVHVIDSNQRKTIAGYHEHQNISYGIDWCYDEPRNGAAIVASCSFYDRLLAVSSWNLPLFN